MSEALSACLDPNRISFQLGNRRGFKLIVFDRLSQYGVETRPSKGAAVDGRSAHFLSEDTGIIMITCLRRTFSKENPNVQLTTALSAFYLSTVKIAAVIPGIISYCDSPDLIQLGINLSRMLL